MIQVSKVEVLLNFCNNCFALYAGELHTNAALLARGLCESAEVSPAPNDSV